MSHRPSLSTWSDNALAESDYLLGVADETRLGALRFRRVGEETFQAPIRAGVPSLIELGRLLQITERILRDEETDEDLQLIFAPGSSLGGARPKASVIDQHGHLSIAKFPKETDDYSMETWEEIALRLAGQAGIATPQHDLVDVAGKAVMLSRRFDRDGAIRIPFLSAMAMMGARDGERGSYPEIVDALAQYGAQGKTDAHALYRRVVFNVLISNVDDHLRNHGFLWLGRAGWSLSPAYDLNPVPTDLKARVLTTNIDLDEGTCSLDLLEQVAGASVDRIAAGEQLIDPSSIARWLELHIEQGPVLVETGEPIAVVSGIRGNVRHRAVRCLGEAGHSGAVPRHLRRDAVVAFADLAMRLDTAWTEALSQRTSTTSFRASMSSATESRDEERKGRPGRRRLQDRGNATLLISLWKPQPIGGCAPRISSADHPLLHRRSCVNLNCGL